MSELLDNQVDTQNVKSENESSGVHTSPHKAYSGSEEGCHNISATIVNCLFHITTQSNVLESQFRRAKSCVIYQK